MNPATASPERPRFISAKVEANAKAMQVRALRAAAALWSHAGGQRRGPEQPAWCHCLHQCDTLSEHWAVADRCNELLLELAGEVRCYCGHPWDPCPHTAGCSNDHNAPPGVACACEERE